MIAACAKAVLWPLTGNQCPNVSQLKIDTSFQNRKTMMMMIVIVREQENRTYHQAGEEQFLFEFITAT